MKRLGIIGFGNMGQAIAAQLFEKKIVFQPILVAESDKNKVRHFEKKVKIAIPTQEYY